MGITAWPHAKIDAHREMLREMARAWTKVAEEAEQTETQSQALVIMSALGQ
jgi:hypothetical protein